MTNPMNTGIAAVALFATLVIGAPARTQQKDPPRKPDKAAIARAASARRLAQKMYPTPEEAKANGDWKLPWEMPPEIVLELLVDVGEIDNAYLYRTAQDGYWEKRGEGWFFLQVMYDFATPTLAAARLRDAEITIATLNDLKSSGIPKDVDALEAKLRMLTLDKLLAWRKEEELKRKQRDGVDSIGEKWTRFVLCRASDWDRLSNLGDVLKVRADLVRKYVEFHPADPDYPVSMDALLTDKMVKDPAWAPADKRAKDALDGCDTPEAFIVKHNMGYSTAVVNVRKLNPDAISGKPEDRLVKDFTEADRKALEDKLNGAGKAMRELVLEPRSEQDVENIRKGIKNLQDLGFKEDSDMIKSQRKQLEVLEQWWKDRISQTWKVTRPDIGAADCYVVSTRMVRGPLSQHFQQDRRPTAIVYLASIRNGNYLAEVEILSTMSEKEAEKDLLFFLKVLQRNTTTDLGAFGTSGTREPKGSSDK